jgi:hypothetical protein
VNGEEVGEVEGLEVGELSFSTGIEVPIKLL